MSKSRIEVFSKYFQVKFPKQACVKNIHMFQVLNAFNAKQKYDIIKFTLVKGTINQIIKKARNANADDIKYTS